MIENPLSLRRTRRTTRNHGPLSGRNNNGNPLDDAGMERAGCAPLGFTFMQTETPRRVLIIQLRRIGDVLLATPIFRALRMAWPTAEITLLLETPFEPVVRHNPHIDHVIALPRKQSLRRNMKAILDLRKRRFDVVIDLLGKPRTALWSWLTGAPRRVGFAEKGRCLFYTDSVAIADPLAYSACHKAELLKPLGIEATDWRLEFPVHESDRHATREEIATLPPRSRLFAVAPGSRRDDKLWMPECFAETADRIADEHQMLPLFVCGPGEESQVEAVRARMKSPSWFNANRPSLPRVQATLEQCALFVGNDTGLRHMAVAAGIPTVAIFGQPCPSNWTPPNDPRHQSLGADPNVRGARATTSDGRTCLSSITVESVLRAARKALTAAEKNA